LIFGKIIEIENRQEIYQIIAPKIKIIIKILFSSEYSRAIGENNIKRL
jgi:hypothetical protein